MTKEERSRLRNESTTKGFRNAVIKIYGDACISCGSKENIEFHHVLPLILGGGNVPSNVVPLCHACHKAVHTGQHMSHYTNPKGTGGRKSFIDNDPEICKYFDMYISGEIGRMKLAELTGYTHRSMTKGLPAFRKYLASKGIADMKNTVDVAGATSGLFEGKRVGFVKYTDGRVEDIIFHDTGANDIDYVKRKYTSGMIRPSSRIAFSKKTVSVIYCFMDANGQYKLF